MTDSNNPIIKDLHWALDSPNLPVPDPLKPLLWQRLHSIEFDPVAQAQWIEPLTNLRHRRLGRYFEALWRCGIELHPEWSLLLSGFAVRDQNRTLGEIDLVIAQAQNDALIHLELAVKFYLRVDHPECGHSHHWLGPSLVDSYEQKLTHLSAHQLPMGQHPQVREQLKRPITEQGLILKGRLFVPASDPSHSAQGIWLSDVALKQQTVFTEYLPLERSQWLTGPAHARWQWIEQNPISPLQHPIMVWLRSNPGDKPQWAMVVPQDWEARARRCCPGLPLSL